MNTSKRLNYEWIVIYRAIGRINVMTARQAIKNIVPVSLRNNVKALKRTVLEQRESANQERRYSRWISRPESVDKARVETRLAFDIHRLEKGLSHQEFRHGFGKHVLSEIAKRMRMLEIADSSYAKNPLYIQGLAVLHEYQKRHEQVGYDLTEIRKLFPSNIWEASQKYIPNDSTNGVSAGSMLLYAESKAKNKSKTFVDLAQNRYSVREYAPTPVSQELLDSAYSVSMKTPSVCNRQATRVYEITNPEIIAKALHIQGGFNGYKEPPTLLFITSDIRAFMDNNERNEPFVDGGLFSMSLLYALEAYGLAACPLNAMFNPKQDKETRELLGIPDYELPIMYIAVGNFPETVPVCVSTRKSPQEIIRIIR